MIVPRGSFVGVFTAAMACFVVFSVFDGAKLQAAAIDFTGKTGWIPLTQGAAFDPLATKANNDNHSAAAGLDVVGDANHASTYMAYDSATDRVGFRVRIGDLPS